jgi:dual specificity phosphatase 12
MGCALRECHLPYKRYLLAQAGHEYEASGTIDTSALAQPEEPGSAASGGGPPPLAYRCRKCRCLVATAHNLVETEEGPGATGFAWRKRDRRQRVGGGISGDSPEDGSLFVEPLRWMDAIVGGPIQGKLYCPKSVARPRRFCALPCSALWRFPLRAGGQQPASRRLKPLTLPPFPPRRCQSRLGSFSWAGIQSSSGAWVTPAFQLHVAKLDAINSQPAVMLSTIRQPRLLPGGSSSSPVSAAADPPPAVAAAVLASGVAGQLAASSLAAGEPRLPAAKQQQQQQQAQQEEQQERYFTHLILDCDGVMVDSERASCEALRRAILQVRARSTLVRSPFHRQHASLLHSSSSHRLASWHPARLPGSRMQRLSACAPRHA